MEAIQIIAIIFALFAYSRAILRYKDKKITNKEFLFWTIIWVSMIIVAIIPIVASWFSNLFGIRRPVDFMIYASIIILFYIIFKIYVKIESLEQDFTKIVRNLAIKKNKKK
ncbi:DUF2304 family protein [Candidatus Woesearchaeota archaeon]|nr:DUF2304 family protein [Candidatus Woesearchaeota archaeon]